jgi:hypothetical protein
MEDVGFLMLVLLLARYASFVSCEMALVLVSVTYVVLCGQARTSFVEDTALLFVTYLISSFEMNQNVILHGIILVAVWRGGEAARRESVTNRAKFCKKDTSSDQAVAPSKDWAELFDELSTTLSPNKVAQQLQAAKKGSCIEGSLQCEFKAESKKLIPKESFTKKLGKGRAKSPGRTNGMKVKRKPKNEGRDGDEVNEARTKATGFQAENPMKKQLNLQVVTKNAKERGVVEAQANINVAAKGGVEEQGEAANTERNVGAEANQPRKSIMKGGTKKSAVEAAEAELQRLEEAADAAEASVQKFSSEATAQQETDLARKQAGQLEKQANAYSWEGDYGTEEDIVSPALSPLRSRRPRGLSEVHENMCEEDKEWYASIFEAELQQLHHQKDGAGAGGAKKLDSRDTGDNSEADGAVIVPGRRRCVSEVQATVDELMCNGGQEWYVATFKPELQGLNEQKERGDILSELPKLVAAGVISEEKAAELRERAAPQASC